MKLKVFITKWNLRRTLALLLLACGVLFFLHRPAYQIVSQLVFSLGIGFALADMFVPEFKKLEKFLIGAFLGPVVLGLAFLYMNILFDVKINSLSSLAVALAIFAFYCVFKNRYLFLDK